MRHISELPVSQQYERLRSGSVFVRSKYADGQERFVPLDFGMAFVILDTSTEPHRPFAGHSPAYPIDRYDIAERVISLYQQHLGKGSSWYQVVPIGDVDLSLLKLVDVFVE